MFADWIAFVISLGLLLPYFVYKKLKEEKPEKVAPYIEEKYDEIYEICEKGHSLL